MIEGNNVVALSPKEILKQEIAEKRAALKALATQERTRYEVIDTKSLINTWDNGVDIKDVDGDIRSLLVRAGLNWDTLKRPLSVREDGMDWHGIEVPDHNALLRSDTGLTLDVVGNRYEPISNYDAFSLFTDFLKEGDMSLDSAGSFKEGRYVWGLAKLKQEITLKGNDKTVGYMMVSAPHVQGASYIMKLITKRITCWNSYQAALNSDTPTLRMTHKANMDNFGLMAKKSIEGFNQSLLEYGKQAEKLLDFDMSFNEAMPILSEVYGFDKEEHLKKGDDLRYQSHIFKDLEHAYNSNPLSDDRKKQTAYDVFNGVTYYHTHMQGRSSEGRLFNTVMGNAAKQATQVLEGLYKIAA